MAHVDRDVADQHPPLGQGGPVLLGGPHHRPTGGVAGEQPVDPVDLERQVRAGAGLAQRGLLVAAGPLDPLPEHDRRGGRGDGQQQERHGQPEAVEHGRAHADQRGAGADEERQVADPLVGLLGQLEGAVPPLDLLEHHGVLGVGAGGLGRLGQSPLPLLDPVGHVPQATLVDAGQGQDVLLDPRPGHQVVGLHAQLPAGAAAVQAGPFQHVEPVVGHELLGHVGRGLGVDDAVTGAGRAEDGVARAGVGLDLEVDPRPSAAERARAAR